jgi:hypothetical protein
MPLTSHRSDDEVVTFTQGYLEPRPASPSAVAFAADPANCDLCDPAGAYRLVRLDHQATGNVICVVDPISRYGRTRSVSVPRAALASWVALSAAITENSDERIGAVAQPDSADVPGLPSHLIATPKA